MKFVLLLLLAAVGAASAQTATPLPNLKPEDGPANYGLCLDTARAYPEQGLDFAVNWQTLGGGEPAKHCAAVAKIGLRRYAEAAKDLTALGIASKRGNDIRAGLLAQAGQAWFLGGELQQANETQDAALKLVVESSPQKAALLIDRAMTLAAREKYQDAIVDLSGALVIDPTNATSLAFRANAYRALQQLDRALSDAERAVKADPKNVEALLERGNVYRLLERVNEARADWAKVVELAPDSEAGHVARAEIERLAR